MDKKETTKTDKPTTSASPVDRLVMCNFSCEAGPLELTSDFCELKEKADLWIVTRKGGNICHTSGKGGWRFTVCTNKEEAEWLANLYNRERYGGAPFCKAERWLEYVEQRKDVLVVQK